MPSLFARRYMRGKPRRTERLVGVFVLCALALIVGLFALTGGLFANVVNRVPLLSKAKDAVGISERPLFVPDPANVKPPEPPHDVKAAQQLLPQQLGDWKRGAVRVEQIAGTDALIWNGPWSPAAQDAVRAGSIGGGTQLAAYRAEYGNGAARCFITILDAGAPEMAFAICHALNGSGKGRTIAVGQGGWVDDSSRCGAFWAGRYCTDLFGYPWLDARSVEQILRGLSKLQLSYGSPFWSETVLPREGRVDGSLTFDRRGALLGLPELTDGWLARYQNGLTVGVTQPGSAERLLASLRQRAASQPAESHPSESEALAASTITWADHEKTLTAFDAGPYVFVIAAPPHQRELVASTAKILHDRWAGAEAPAAAGRIDSQAASHKTQASAAGIARFAAVDGLDTPAKTERYTDNLYEKIDGREGQFRAFNFVELRFGQYLDGRNKHSFDVYLYDMAEPNNALGIFMKERSSAEASAGVGRDSYISGTNVYYWKGKYYVNVLGPADGGETALASAKKIASAIAETIADTGGGFWAEEVLPKEERIPESFKYIATSALSYDFLNRVYRADYKAGDKAYGLFALKASSPERARELYLQLADAAKKYGDIIEQRVDTPGSELVVTRSIDVYMVAFCKGVFVGGAADCDDKELAIQKAGLLRERMPIDAPGEPEAAAAGANAADAQTEDAATPSKTQNEPADGESQDERNGY